MDYWHDLHISYYIETYRTSSAMNNLIFRYYFTQLATSILN